MNAFALTVPVILGICISELAGWSINQYPLKDYPLMNRTDYLDRDVGAIIHMTLEFLKDMDMKMRDVRRVEKKYVRTEDFGAGKIFSGIEHTFEHMVKQYKIWSAISHVMKERDIDLRRDIVGSLQFMLSDYMELLSLVDLYRARYDYWRRYSDEWRVKDKVQNRLLLLKQYPYRYKPEDE